jgi:hypothetical protein
MNGRFNIVRTALVLSLIAIGFATSAYALFRERTVHYWAWTYGDGVPAYEAEYNCSCMIGPCAGRYEIVGEKEQLCDGTTSEWGYVGHPCADTTVTLGPRCE